METKNKCGRNSAILKILQATIVNSSMDEVKEKDIAFLPGNFYNVRFSENYCCAVHKGDAERLSDLIHKYRSVLSTSII